MASAVLTLNAGSSSLKFALFEVASPNAEPEDLVVLARGQIEGLGQSPHFVARDASGAVVDEDRFPVGAQLTHEAFLARVLGFADAHLAGETLIAVGHRIVHGGDRYFNPVRLDAAVLDDLETLDVLAPLHQPHNLAAARAAAAARPDIPQVGVFDTAFHASLSPTARRFALPRAYEERGVKRYGFHGLSYQWLGRRLAALDPTLAHGRVVMAHLGAGASLCAAVDGRSVDTTMGFTALDGLVMGTRSGNLDPGVVLHLMTAEGMDATAITDLLYKRSGLLGVSGESSDMRALLASASMAAADAVDLFVWRAVREIGSMTMAMGGLDGIVFSAGIGENSAEIRRRICARLSWLGLATLETDAAGERRISAPDSPIAAWVIPTDEERMIAAGVLAALD